MKFLFYSVIFYECSWPGRDDSYFSVAQYCLSCFRKWWVVITSGAGQATRPRFPPCWVRRVVWSLRARRSRTPLWSVGARPVPAPRPAPPSWDSTNTQSSTHPWYVTLLLELPQGTLALIAMETRTPSPYKDCLSRHMIPILKIRKLWDRLIFIMGIPIVLRHCLYIEMDPTYAITPVLYWDGPHICNNSSVLYIQ